EVIGIFEVFSNKPRAFQERDLLALERMGEMVNTALDQVKSPKTKMTAGLESNAPQLTSAAPGSATSTVGPGTNLQREIQSVEVPQGAPPEGIVEAALHRDHRLLFGASTE